MKVVCTDDRNHHEAVLPCPLKRGEIYTVTGREIINGQVGYSLAGIDPTPGFTHFHSQRFRPFDEPLKRVSFQIGADPDSERWDNRKKIKERT